MLVGSTKLQHEVSGLNFRPIRGQEKCEPDLDTYIDREINLLPPPPETKFQGWTKINSADEMY